MIDQEFFKDRLADQVTSMGECTGIIHLHNGQEFRIRRIVETYRGYVAFEVFPAEGMSDESKEKRKKKPGDGTVIYDRIIVPYENISYVLLTIAEKESERNIGFPATKPTSKSN
jgi:hypothetical protein